MIGFEDEPLRAYSGVNEMNAFWKTNKDVRVEAEQANEDADSEQKLTGAEEAAVDKAVVDAIYMMSKYKDNVFKSKYSLAENSIKAKAVRVAMEGKVQLTMPYPAPPRESQNTKKIVQYDDTGKKEVHETDDGDE